MKLKVNEVQLDRVERAVATIAKKDDGTVISYEELKAHWGITDMHRIRQIRHRLAVDHSRLTEAVRGVGFELVPPRDGVRLSEKHVGRSYRQLRRAGRTLANTRVKELDVIEASRHVETMRIVGGLASMVGPQAREVRAIASGKELPTQPDAMKVLATFRD